MNSLFLAYRPGRRVVALKKVENGTEAGTQAQVAVHHLNGDSSQAARIQGLGWRQRTLRRMAGDGRRFK